LYDLIIKGRGGGRGIQRGHKLKRVVKTYACKMKHLFLIFFANGDKKMQSLVLF
jgi:hypothetical protein